MLVGGGSLFASGFVPWWFRTTTVDGSTSYNAGLTDFTVVAVLAGAVAAIAVLARAAIWPEPAPDRDSILYGALGLVAVIALMLTALVRNGVWVGTYAGLALAGVLLLGGVRRRRERRAGWT